MMNTAAKHGNILSRFRVDFICAAYLVIWCLVPPLALGTIYRVFAIIAAAIWYILTLENYPEMFQHVKLFSICGYGCSALIVIILSFSGVGIVAAIKRVLKFCIITLVGTIGITYYIYEPKYLKYLFVLCLGIYIIWGITSINGIYDYAYAARIANDEWLEERWEQSKNVGTYGFMYGAVLGIPCLFYGLINRIFKNRIINLMVFAVCVIGTYMVLIAGYTFGLIIFAFELLLVFINSGKSNRVRKHILGIFIVIVAVLYGKELLEKLLLWLIDIFEDRPTYHDKWYELYQQFFNDAEAGGTYAGRFERYEKTWTEFWKYPVLGSYILGGNGVGGGHTFLMDQMLLYGWPIGIIEFITVFLLYRKIHVSTIIKILIAATTVFLIVDPIFQELSIPLYIFGLYVNLKYLGYNEEVMLYDKNSLGS